jgi:hypothetical protein
MKAVLRILGGLVGAVLFLFIAEWIIFLHYDAGPPAISLGRAILLMNQCGGFANVGESRRRLVSISHISKGQGGADAASDMSFADIKWQWISGPKAQTLSYGAGTVSFEWVPVAGLGDWSFPESQWRVGQVFDGENVTKCEAQE